MDNWFLICKHVYFNLTCSPIRTVSGPLPAFSVPALAESPGCGEFFSQVHDAGIKNIFEHH